MRNLLDRKLRGVPPDELASRAEADTDARRVRAHRMHAARRCGWWACTHVVLPYMDESLVEYMHHTAE
eukprot:COSAG02_NODE_4972_length_4769_cov_4.798116_2_plen_68_part_00